MPLPRETWTTHKMARSQGWNSNFIWTRVTDVAPWLLYKRLSILSNSHEAQSKKRKLSASLPCLSNSSRVCVSSSIGNSHLHWRFAEPFLNHTFYFRRKNPNNCKCFIDVYEVSYSIALLIVGSIFFPASVYVRSTTLFLWFHYRWLLRLLLWLVAVLCFLRISCNISAIVG